MGIAGVGKEERYSLMVSSEVKAILSNSVQTIKAAAAALKSKR